MPMRFNLDFSLKSSKERLQFLKDNVDFSVLTKKDIETCTDYVLYGKDSDGKSVVDRKEVYIKTRYKSYNHNEPVSLEALMESPTFDESIFKKEKDYYKKPKPNIDRNDEKLQKIPGMKELWEAIDQIQHKIDLAQGKTLPDGGETVPQLDSKQLYHLNHHLIELRNYQYLLKDSVCQEIQSTKNYGSFYQDAVDFQVNYPVFPCGLMSDKNDKDFLNPYKSKREFKAIDVEEEVKKLKAQGKPFINFLDKEHIYQLCLSYYEIRTQGEKNPDSPLNNLIWTLDFYIEKANLSEQQKLIVECKKKRLLNREICKVLMDEMGIYHQENYISTIWNKVCQLIADAASLHLDEWCCKDYEPAWKKCNCCGEMMLRDSRNFVKKSKSPDGLTNRCKKCDQKKRRGEI